MSEAFGGDIHMPETGTATCNCNGHKIVVNADTDPRMKPDDRTVMVSFWSRGSHGPYAPSIGSRLRHAWKWLRGRPEQGNDAILKRDEALKLLDATLDAIKLTWPEYDGKEVK